MSVHIVYEVRLLLYSFATGAGLMMTYDFLRILRIFIPHLPVIMGVEDMVYWVYASPTILCSIQSVLITLQNMRIWLHALTMKSRI